MQKMAEKFEERCANARKKIKEDPALITYYRSILSMCDCSINKLEASNPTTYDHTNNRMHNESVYEDTHDLDSTASESEHAEQYNDKLREYLEHSKKNNDELSKGYEDLGESISDLSSSLNDLNSELDSQLENRYEYPEEARDKWGDENNPDTNKMGYVSGEGYTKNKNAEAEIISPAEHRIIIKQKLLEGKEDVLKKMGYTPKEIYDVWENLSSKEKVLEFEKNHYIATSAIDAVKSIAVTPPVDFFLTTILNDKISINKALKAAEYSTLKKVKFLTESPKQLAKFYKKRGHPLTQEQISRKIKDISAGIQTYEDTKKKVSELESALSKE